MYRYEFAGYDPDKPAKDTPSALAFAHLRAAIYAPDDNRLSSKEEWRRMLKVQDKFESLEEKRKVSDGSGKLIDATALRAAGGSILLEDAEHELVKRSWERLRDKLSSGSALPVVVTDEFLDALKPFDVKLVDSMDGVSPSAEVA